MTHSSSFSVHAPCIINTGTIVNRDDMLRVLSRLNHVAYRYVCGGKYRSQGTATIADVFSEPQQATLLADRLLHLNLDSFDYLELRQEAGDQAQFVLVRGDEQLCLEPIAGETEDDVTVLDNNKTLSDASLEFALAHIIAAKLDAHLDGNGDIDCTTW